MQRFELGGLKSMNAKGYWRPSEARREAWEDSPAEPPEGVKCADIFILDFLPPEL